DGTSFQDRRHSVRHEAVVGDLRGTIRSPDDGGQPDIADQRELATDDGCKVPLQDEGCALVRELAAFDECIAGADDDGRLHRKISEEEYVRAEADRSIRETAGAIPAAHH